MCSSDLALSAGVPVKTAAPAPVPVKEQPAPKAEPAPAPVQEAAPAAQAPAPVEAPPAPAESASADDEERPFAQWGEVIERLGTACMPLQGVLIGSTAFIRGDYVLVCTDNEMFKALVTKDGNKQIFLSVIREVIGRNMRIGIKKKATVQDDIPEDPLAAFLQRGRAQGVNITTEE